MVRKSPSRAHLSKIWGMMPDFGCQQHREMGRQNSLPGRASQRRTVPWGCLVQPQHNRTLKDEVFIPNPSSVLISSNLKVILQQRTTGLSPLPLPRNTPDWLQVAVRTSFFAGEHLCKNRASFLFSCALWKWLQDLTAWTCKSLSQLRHIWCALLVQLLIVLT